nr:MAG TPA: hypothetical protein [Caudoviricetes sp.]
MSMTNYEKYKNEINKITRMGRRVAVETDTNKICTCDELSCGKCLFADSVLPSCSMEALEWADAEYIEPEVDWSKVPVDTPILVSDDNKRWYRSYFAEYNNEDHQVWTWRGGRTSWSINYDGAYLVSNREAWKYAKLAEVDNGI